MKAEVTLPKKWSFPLKISSANVTKSTGSCGFRPQVPADFVTFTEEILNGKLHFLCSVNDKKVQHILVASDLDIQEKHTV